MRFDPHVAQPPLGQVDEHEALEREVEWARLEITGDDVAGASSDVAALLAATAQPGEILATRIVEDLVVGSGTAFADRGTHRLGGTAREWSLVAVTEP